MDSGITASIISASGAIIVAGLAIGANTYWMGRSFDLIGKSIDDFKASVKERLDVIQTDLKEVVKITNELDRRIDRLEHKP
jgi:hypothetical protein